METVSVPFIHMSRYCIQYIYEGGGAFRMTIFVRLVLCRAAKDLIMILDRPAFTTFNWSQLFLNRHFSPFSFPPRANEPLKELPHCHISKHTLFTVQTISELTKKKKKGVLCDYAMGERWQVKGIFQNLTTTMAYLTYILAR